MSSKVFNKILIANRGEIACRVIKTARNLGIRTVAVYSDADVNALHVVMADEAVHLGPAPSKDSYLDIDKVINAALRTGADAIHPGYGFLSENAAFSDACKKNDIVFIGPPVDAIKAMGSKSAAKQIMEKAQVPLVPGYHGEDQNPAIIKQAADDMGYPVLLKAAAGGGGKGMRQVWQESEFDAALDAAKREAMNGFGDDTMLVEKYLTQPRHVEIQVFCDSHGNAVYVFERDCSVQRRHQKIIEEAPAPGISQELRSAMGDAAIRAAKAINYEGAGTVEFLLDTDGAFYFMEMNTRLQVEHPVTEMISGLDLVEWQLKVAAGELLPKKQEELKISGHAFEARIYAEDPNNDFLPVTGKLSYLQTPVTDDKVRVDTGVRQGDEVSIYYDPMIAKLVVWDEDRDKALRRLGVALSQYRVSGMKTNLDFLYNLATSEPFKQADLDTSFIEKHSDAIFHTSDRDLEKELSLAGLFLFLKQQHDAEQASAYKLDPTSPWNRTNAWRMNEANTQNLRVKLFHGGEEQIHELSVEQNSTHKNRYLIHLADRAIETSGSLMEESFTVSIDGLQTQVKVAEHDGEFTLYYGDAAVTFARAGYDIETAEDHSEASLSAPMNGTMVTLLVAPGATVKKDDPLLVMEAMKMEHTIRAPSDGSVAEFFFQPGDLVDGGAELLAFEAAS